jgi:hypothetical protein
MDSEAKAIAFAWIIRPFAPTIIRQMTGDDQELVHGLKSRYADRSNWPERVRDGIPHLLDERILNFLRPAVAACAAPYRSSLTKPENCRESRRDRTRQICGPGFYLVKR